jgi:HEAT repeat protein
MQSSRLFWATAVLLAAVVVAFGLRADDKPPAKLEPKETPAPTNVAEIEGKNLQDWIKDLRHEDPSVREKAIRAIILFGPQATIAVPDLVDRCLDPDASPRVRAVIALTVIDIQDKDRSRVIEALNRRLIEDDPQGIIRYHASLALTRFGDEAKAAIPGLVKAVSERSSFDTRRIAIVALRKIARDHKNGPDPRATNALLERLVAGVEPAMEVKIEAMVGLGVMGRPADKALLKKVETTLEAYKNSQNKLLSIWAWYGLMAHAEVDEKGLDAISNNAKSREAGIRVHTATALGTIGSKARTHVEVVTKMLDDKDGGVFVAACGALVNIGGEKAKKALTDIAEAKDDAEPKPDPARKLVAQMSLKALDSPEKGTESTDVKDKKGDK